MSRALAARKAFFSSLLCALTLLESFHVARKLSRCLKWRILVALTALTSHRRRGSSRVHGRFRIIRRCTREHRERAPSKLSELPRTRGAPRYCPTTFWKGCHTCNNLNRLLTPVKTTLASDRKVSPLFDGSANALSSSDGGVCELFVRRVYSRGGGGGGGDDGGRVYKLERGNTHRLCNQICTVITKPNILPDYFATRLFIYARETIP